MALSMSRSSVQKINSPGPGAYDTPANNDKSVKDSGERGLYLQRKNGQMVIRRQPMNKFNYVHGRSGHPHMQQQPSSSAIPTVVVQPTLKHNPSAVVLSNLVPSPTPDKEKQIKINQSLKHLHPVRTPGHGQLGAFMTPAANKGLNALRTPNVFGGLGSDQQTMASPAGSSHVRIDDA